MDSTMAEEDCMFIAKFVHEETATEFYHMVKYASENNENDESNSKSKLEQMNHDLRQEIERVTIANATQEEELKQNDEDKQKRYISKNPLCVCVGIPDLDLYGVDALNTAGDITMYRA
eukprot:394641_1